MTDERFGRVTSRRLTLKEEDIDTDQIIPARFLTTTEKHGLSGACFHDWRYDANGRLTDHMLNKANMNRTEILLAGRNFGCGSSREHAPWALLALGFKVIISTEIADIFRSNALKNGLLTVVITQDEWDDLAASPDEQDMTVDLEQNEIRAGNKVINFEIEPFSRYCLLNGQDSLDILKEALPEILAFEKDASWC